MRWKTQIPEFRWRTTKAVVPQGQGPDTSINESARWFLWRDEIGKYCIVISTFANYLNLCKLSRLKVWSLNQKHQYHLGDTIRLLESQLLPPDFLHRNLQLNRLQVILTYCKSWETPTQVIPTYSWLQCVAGKSLYWESFCYLLARLTI